MITISAQTARRFVLGKQGLWPGRRWKGKKGTSQAIRDCEAVQLDPLNIFARSQDIVLHSRVLDYKPDYLYQVAYRDREFFDYGGWLAMYPMTELPYWRVHMERRKHHKRIEGFMLTNPELFESVRAVLRTRGPLGNRHFNGNAVANNYRGRKDTSFLGLFREAVLRSAMQGDMQQGYSRLDASQMIERWVQSGKACEVQVEGRRDVHLVLEEDVSALDLLEKGKVPKGWNPKWMTTLEEVTFLSPLDIVSARGRAKKLFDFDYKWEVYTPLHLRRWGYYVLPILYGDDLVARIDLKLDRSTETLEIKGFWHEEDSTLNDGDFANAFAKGLVRFAKFIGARKAKAEPIQPAKLRRFVEKTLRTEL